MYRVKRTIFGETNTVIHTVLLLQRAFVGMGAVREQTLQLGQVPLPFDVVHVP